MHARLWSQCARSLQSLRSQPRAIPWLEAYFLSQQRHHVNMPPRHAAVGPTLGNGTGQTATKGNMPPLAQPVIWDGPPTAPPAHPNKITLLDIHGSTKK
jgi:hypothetical protein